MQRPPPEKVVENVRKLVEELSKTVKVEKVFLFGSYARGTWLRTSDVDLIIVSRDFEGMSFGRRLDLVNSAAWRLRLSPPVEPLAYTPEELERKISESAVVSDASRYWLRLV
ncbi:MAG: nucleotidyltransferase domain-containing protein [Candidatus Caldarchaeum sp.]|nr:nucleotidyltransferase domain-containing protein [Candidatus Caldarchaeum sp.]